MLQINNHFGMNRHSHICGLYYVVAGRLTPERKYLPQLSLSAHAQIVSSTSRTTLTQNFVNPQSEAIPELRYTFPLYDGVSVVGFVCTINGDRVIHGVVKERAQARQTYQAAVDRGETAGLLEQLPEASDVFTTTVGNVPANATLKVEITYLGELKQDAEVDGIRFTIPTRIAPRYGLYPGAVLPSPVKIEGGISIVVDVEMPDGSNVKNVQSPSHPIAVTLGNTSAGAASGADMSLQKASATLALNTTELGDDFVLQVVATNTGNPIAVLETHPTLLNHRALMATLVPKFNLPSSKPEIVFLCDRSGSMQGYKNENLKTALQLFLKSLPVGVKFNICSFGSRHEFLFADGSRTYDASSLQMASSYVDKFTANFGGTNIYNPMADAIKKRYTDMDLEVFLLTDGEIWDQNALFGLLNQQTAESKDRIRVFSLGIGTDVSHALIEGVAAAGNGFSQSVGDNENMNSKVVRMLKASLTPHIKDYTLEVKYGKDAAESASDDDFEIVEKVMDGLTIDVREPADAPKEEAPKKPISLFDESANPDVEMTDASLDTSAGGKYSHVPPVSEPKFLQAPFAIPPLYPFNRTTVYLLLSPETAQKQPKSVVLRGSSAVGPVELEIPVTVLAEKSETIHQLAARKAVRELEDGRGWIYHAKDAAGALLKDKYPGRFNDMVEREAVRLGVTYQVGGKWCSFVAVEGNKEAEEAEEAVRPPSPPKYKVRDRDSASLPSAQPAMPSTRHRASRRPCSYNKPSASTQQQQYPMAQDSIGVTEDEVYIPTKRCRGGASPEPSSSGEECVQFAMLDFYSSPTPPPPPAPAPSHALRQCRALPPGTTSEASYRPPQAAQMRMQMSQGAPPAMGAFGGGGRGRLPLMAKAARRSARVTSHSAPVSGVRLGRDDDDEDEEDGGAPPPIDVATFSPAEKLNLLVALQSFEGSWRWEERVLAVVGLGKDVDGVAQRAVAAQIAGAASDVLATALVLAYLKVVLGEKRDEWEMLADKAREWLEGKLTETGEGRGVEEYCEVVKGFLKKEVGLA